MLFEAINQISNDGPLTMSVSGHCMSGCLADGSRVQIARRTIYWPGDIVVYGRGDDRLVVHRFLGYAPTRRGWHGVTRADNAARADVPVAVERIIGKVITAEKTAMQASVWQRLRSMAHFVDAMTRFSVLKVVRCFEF